MPIRRFIGDVSFNPETVHAMTMAFDDALKELCLADRNDPLAEMLAKKIIEIAGLGERDPKRLRELALKAIQG